MDTHYHIEITGEISPYADRDKALATFGQRFKLDGAAVNRMFSQAPVVIKRQVDAATGEKFLHALKSMGVEARMVRESGEADTQAPEPAQTVEASAPTAAATQTPTAEAPAEPLQPGFPFRIEGRPDYAFLTVELPANDTLKVEASAMATMDTNIQMKTKLKGGFSRFLSGESIFINQFTAAHGPGDISIAPGPPGDLAHVYLNNDTIYLQNSAFVACAMGVEVETKWQGLTKGFFSGESLFLIRCIGQGDLWFNTYGAMIEIDVNGDYVVDTGNIVAFTEGLDYRISKVGGYKSLFFSGEGFVCRFSGQGKVWIQTRGTQAFVSWAHWYRQVKSRN